MGEIIPVPVWIIYQCLFKFVLDNQFGQAGLLYGILRPTNTYVSSRVRQCIGGVAIITGNLTKGNNIDHNLKYCRFYCNQKSFSTKL